MCTAQKRGGFFEEPWFSVSLLLCSWATLQQVWMAEEYSQALACPMSSIPGTAAHSTELFCPSLSVLVHAGLIGQGSCSHGVLVELSPFLLTIPKPCSCQGGDIPCEGTIPCSCHCWISSVPPVMQRPGECSPFGTAWSAAEAPGLALGQVDMFATTRMLPPAVPFLFFPVSLLEQRK